MLSPTMPFGTGDESWIQMLSRPLWVSLAEPCHSDYQIGYNDTQIAKVMVSPFDDRPFGLNKRITAIHVWLGYIIDR